MAEESRSLIPSGQASISGPTFTQQGQWDWAAIGRSTVGFTVDVLSRMSKAGVEGLTLAVAYNVALALRLGPRGEQRVQRSISQLKAFSSFNSVLTFGFGVKHIIREMAESVEGLSCVAICAALREVYNPVNAAEVLREMCRLCGPPKDLQPSLRQWIRLLEACEGALGGTNFGLVCRQTMKMYPGFRDRGARLITSAGIESVASALFAIGRVSSGSVAKVTISGGPDCGWIAAVAELLLDIDVEIYDGDNGSSLMYSSKSRVETTSTATRDQSGRKPRGQLGIMYTTDAVGLGPHPEKHVSIISKVYHVPSGNAIVDWRDVTKNNILSCGKVPWDKLLRFTFGTAAERLLSDFKVGEAAGTLLGRSTSLYELYATGAVLPPNGTRQDYDAYFDYPITVHSGSYGQGLLNIVRSWFPEIESCEVVVQSMQRGYEGSVNLDLTALKQAYARAVCVLCGLCDCEDCRRFTGRDAQEGCVDENTASPGISTDGYQPFCFIIIMETICKLARLFSRLHFPTLEADCNPDARLLPSQTGIEYMYMSNRGHASPCAVDKFFLGYESFRGVYIEPIVEVGIVFGSGLRVIQHQHYEEAGKTWGMSAFTMGGLCMVINPLLEPDDDPERACIIHVAPGNIAWEGTFYESVYDAEPNSGVWSKPALKCPKEKCAEAESAEVDVADLAQRLDNLDSTSFTGNGSLTLEVTDQLDSSSFHLTAVYKLSTKSGNTYHIYPRELQRYIATTSIGPICPSTKCKPGGISTTSVADAAALSVAPGVNVSYKLVHGEGHIRLQDPDEFQDQISNPSSTRNLVVYLRAVGTDLLPRMLSLVHSYEPHMEEYGACEVYFQHRSCRNCMVRMAAGHAFKDRSSDYETITDPDDNWLGPILSEADPPIRLKRREAAKGKAAADNEAAGQDTCATPDTSGEPRTGDEGSNDDVAMAGPPAFPTGAGDWDEIDMEFDDDQGSLTSDNMRSKIEYAIMIFR